MTSRNHEHLSVCTYCRMPIAPGGLERDHFPIPQDSGGTTTVPVCRNCHSLKDRVALDSLPGGDAVVSRLCSTYGTAGPSPMSLIDLWGRVPGLSADDTALPPQWDVMPPLDRVVWSRLLALRVRYGTEAWTTATAPVRDAAQGVPA